jgi:hypothetical protein
VKVYNINWIDEDGNENTGTALFSEFELAEFYMERMLNPMNDGNTYSVGELFVVTEL